MTTNTATTKTEPAWLVAARRRRWTPEVAAEVVRAWEAEGGTQSAFMRKWGLPRERLRFWTQRREGRQAVRAARSFVPVEVAPAAQRLPEAAGAEGVEVAVGGVRLRVGAGASEALVARVLRAVKEVEGC